FVVFDVLQLAGTSTLDIPLDQRRTLLDALAVDDADHIMTSPVVNGTLEDAMSQSREEGFEGIVAKRCSSLYRPGTRSENWLKFKHEQMAEVLVIGWRPGNGEREESIGSLLMAIRDDEQLRYAGRVGTGFNQQQLKDLAGQLSKLRTSSTSVDVPENAAKDA